MLIDSNGSLSGNYHRLIVLWKIVFTYNESLLALNY